MKWRRTKLSDAAVGEGLNSEATIVAIQAKTKRIKASIAIRLRANFRLALCSTSSVTTYEWPPLTGFSHKCAWIVTRTPTSIASEML